MRRRVGGRGYSPEANSVLKSSNKFQWIRCPGTQRVSHKKYFISGGGGVGRKGLGLKPTSIF